MRNDNGTEKGDTMKMDAATRTAWYNGKDVRAADFTCDTCDSPAVALSHSGRGSDVMVECGACYMARTEAERKNRPTRSELISRVNEAIVA